MNRQTILAIHRWLGIIFGVLIFLICISGAILIFSPGGHPAPPFFEGVKSFHRFLFLAPENTHGGMSVGRFLIGTSAIAMTLILLTGIYLWWPKSKKMLKNRLTVKTSKGFRRFVYDCHVSLGIYAVVFLLLMSLTGPSWSFDWYKTATVAVLGGEQEPDFSKMPPGMDKPGNNEGQMPMDMPMPPQGDNHQMHHDGKPHGDMHHGDFHGGKKPAQFVIMELHTGKWAGWFSKTIYFLAALIGASLPVSGYYMWWKRRKTIAAKK